MPDEKIKGLNKINATLADGSSRVYWYDRKSGVRLPGEYGSDEFLKALAAAREKKRAGDTLTDVIRAFEQTAKWRRLADSTKAEYRRIFKFWDGKFGSMPAKALSAKAFRREVLAWHDEFSAEKPREADNRITVLARVLSWAASDGPVDTNVLASFDRAYDSNRSDLIWLPEHVEAFMAKAGPEMQLAFVLALHTGQRQGDIRKMAWGNYDGTSITIRQGKTKALVRIPCTKALRETLDGMKRRGAVILTTKTGRPFTPDYLKKQFAKVRDEAGIENLHFHDLRGTTVTLLFEAGCSVAEAASITGHSLKTAQQILDKYLSRTSVLAEAAIAKLETRLSVNGTKTEPAK